MTEIHAQATGNLKQTEIIDKVDEFLKHKSYSEVFANVVINKCLRLELSSQAFPRQRF